MGFTKLDSGIVDSSIWAEPLATRVVWITILAKCNHQGIVYASRSGLLRASNVSEKEFDEAILSLESPDPDSRTTDNDGIRIRKIEGGWEVLNYLKYREYTYSSNPESVRQREYRKKKTVTSCDMSQNQRDISASASSSASKEEEVQEKGKKKFIKPTIEEITEYCNSRKNTVNPQKFYDYYESKGWVVGKSPMKNWQAAIRTWEGNGYRSAEPSKPKYCGAPPDYNTQG